MYAGLLSCLFGSAFAQSANATAAPPHALAQPEQRVALVIGNSNYERAAAAQSRQ